MKRTTPKAIAAIEPGCDRLERVLALALSELLMGLAAGVASNRLNPFLPAVGEFVGIVRTVGVRFEIVGTASVVGVLMNKTEDSANCNQHTSPCSATELTNQGLVKVSHHLLRSLYRQLRHPY